MKCRENSTKLKNCYILKHYTFESWHILHVTYTPASTFYVVLNDSISYHMQAGYHLMIAPFIKRKTTQKQKTKTQTSNTRTHTLSEGEIKSG